MLQWSWFGWINGRNHLEFDFQLPHSNLETKKISLDCLMSQLISQGYTPIDRSSGSCNCQIRKGLRFWGIHIRDFLENQCSNQGKRSV